MRPTPRLAAVVGAGALLALAAPAAALAVVALVLVAAALDVVRLRGPVSVQRDLAPVLVRGAAAPLRVDVEPAARTLVRQPLPPGLVAVAPEAAPPGPRDGSPGPGSTGLRPTVGAAMPADVGRGGLRAGVVARRRGAHELPPVVVRRTGPLGLVRRDVRAGGVLPVTVYPDYVAAERLASAARAGRGPTGERRRGPLGLGTEFEQVRDWVPGDDVRQVNWLATWRTGRPMSNQFRVESERDVVLLVDCGRLVGAPAGGGAAGGGGGGPSSTTGTLLDAQMDAVAAVAATADALGDRVGAVAFAGDVLVATDPARGGGRTCLRALHAVQPVGVESDYAAAFARVGSARRAFVLLLTDLVDEAAARPLADAAPTLARRHALTVAGVEDAALRALADRRPEDEDAALRQAVAADVLAARDRAAVALGVAGAGVLVAPPGDLADRCVAAYLDAKARARF